MAKNPFPLSKEQLLEAYRTMRTIREFEERLHAEFAKGDIPGFVHLYAGEEAAGTGIMMHLNDSDRIASTHRGHGHCIAKGVDVEGDDGGDLRQGGRLLPRQGRLDAHRRSLQGHDGRQRHPGRRRAAGLRRGACRQISRRWRRRHLASSATAPRTRACSSKASISRRCGICPAIFVVENNGYAESTSRDYAVAVDSYVDRAAGFGLPGVTVDGTDFFAVYEAAGEIIKRAREGGGPALLECKMIRFFGHFEGDQQTYRGKGEVEDIRANKDCIKLFPSRVHRGRRHHAAPSSTTIDQRGRST